SLGYTEGRSTPEAVSTSMTTGPDTAPVRPDEALDRQALADWLRGRLPGSEAPLELTQFPGGPSNPTHLLPFRQHEDVLRRPPPAGGPGRAPRARHGPGVPGPPRAVADLPARAAPLPPLRRRGGHRRRLLRDGATARDRRAGRRAAGDRAGSRPPAPRQR